MQKTSYLIFTGLIASLLILGNTASSLAAPPPYQRSPSLQFEPLSTTSSLGGIISDSPLEETSYSYLSSGRVLPALGQTTTPYTWTVSYFDQATASPMVKNLYIDEAPVEMSLISGVAGNGTYQYSGTMPSGIHNFRFQFTDSAGGTVLLPGTGNYSGPTVNTNPTLSQGRVDQAMGSPTTLFTWIVNYNDPDSQVPDSKQVYIDGTPHTMTLYNGQAWNAIYIFQSTLSTGFHQFYFQFSDSWGGTVRLPAEGTYNGPTVSNVPVLVNAQVLPTSGFETSTYAYKVDYFDPSGLAPSLAQIILDGNTGNMSLVKGTPGNGTYGYYLANVLKSGIHTYAYNFTNPYGINVRVPTSGTFSAPTVVQLTAPTNLKASVLSYTQVYLNWTDNSSDESGFKIDYKIGDGEWTYLTSLGANVTQYTHSGLAPFKWYTYRVYGYKYDRVSGLTNTATAGPGLWINPMGDFDVSYDSTLFGFETPAEASQQPGYSWINAYSGKTGLLRLSFSSATQGMKMTSLARIDSTGSQRWHRIRITYLADNFNTGIEVLPYLYTYPTFVSYDIKDIAATWTGLGIQSANVWHTVDTYLYSRETSGLIQLIVKNNGKPVNVYIDSIEWANMAPPALSNPVEIPVPYGDFDVASDSTQWGYQPVDGYSSILPTISWESAAAAHEGVLYLYASETNQCLKQTSLDAFNVPAGRNAVMKINIYPAMDNPDDTHVMAFLMGEKSFQDMIYEFGANVHIGNLTGNQWNEFYAPLTSISSQTSQRLQFFVKNNTNVPAHYYIDDIKLVYEGPVVTVPEELSAEGIYQKE